MGTIKRGPPRLLVQGAGSGNLPCSPGSALEVLNHELNWQHHLADLRGVADQSGLYLGGAKPLPDHHRHSFWLAEHQTGVCSACPLRQRSGGVANSPLLLIFNVIWLLLFGWPLVLNHLFWAVILAVTVVGIPFAKQHLKLVILSLLPFGRDLR